MSSASRKTKRDRVDFGRKPRRLAPTQRARKRVLIVGEGQETEHNYFSGLGADPRVKRVFVVLVKRGAGGSAADVVQIAQREIERDRKRFGERPD